MKSRWILALSVALLWASGFAPSAVAAQQETPAPADETEAARQADAAEGEPEKKKISNGLYVEVGVGASDMGTLDMSTRTSSAQSSNNSLTFEDMEYGRAAIGWKLPGNKGRFRVVWESHKEDGYVFSAVGRESSLGSNPPSNPAITQNLDWWDVDVVDGNLTATRTAPFWTIADDANNDGVVQRGEPTYGAPSAVVSAAIEPNLQNRVQVTDVLYGRNFGPRRVEGSWWGGMRYFAYEGTLMQAAWVRPVQGGLGFTDGGLIPLIHSAQKATAIGPTGSFGVQVNFFDKQVQLFANGQFAFLLSDIEVDTGQFFTLTGGNTPGIVLSTPARLSAERDRTSWHTGADIGMRYASKKGLVLEVSYYTLGYLDAIITPTDLRIPQNAQEAAQGTSGLFATQDITLDGIRGSVAFQF